jgi:transmembrane sensor
MENEISFELLTKYFSGTCSEQEKQMVENWRSSAKENEEKLEDYRLIWRNAGKQENSFNPNAEAALKKINQKLDYSESTAQDHKTIRMVYNAVKVAAAVLLLIGLFILFKTFNPKPAATFSEVVTGKGEKKEVLLSDGSHVWLNALSKIKYPAAFAQKERHVILDGEAYFEVAKNPKKPFVIETANSLTTVLGTCFNVRARKGEEKVVVTVAEGKVAFKGKSQASQVKLIAGEKGVLSLQTGSLVSESNSDPNFMAWKTGKLVFKNTALKDVAKTLSDYYGVKINIVHTDKSDIPFTSTFENQKIGDIIRIIELSLNLKADSSDNEIQIR